MRIRTKEDMGYERLVSWPFNVDKRKGQENREFIVIDLLGPKPALVGGFEAT